MSTNRQRFQARLNGSKSQGANSPQGRAVSALNGTSHGLYAQSACLASENREIYLQHHEMFRRRHQPADPFEDYIVTRMADIEWKLLRAGHIESSLLDAEVDTQIPQLAEVIQDIDAPGLWAAAFRSLAQTPILHAMDRGQGRLSRQYAKLRHELEQLQSKSKENEKGQLEPDSAEPTPE